MHIKDDMPIDMDGILTFDAVFSTNTAEPGNWGEDKLLLRDTWQQASSFVKRFMYLAGMFHYVRMF